MGTIHMSSTLQEFFHEQVSSTLRYHGVAPLPETEFYLVQLLSRFSKTDSLYLNEGHHQEESALCQLLERALEADGPARRALLQRLGDIALYLAGYFPESLSRKLIDLNYYIQMGGTAYHSLSQLLSESSQQELYLELGHKFPTWVEVLSTISAETQSHSEQDLLRLYESWIQSGSRVALSLLHKKGLIPHGGSDTSH